MNTKDLFDQIDNLYEEYLEVWADVTAIESPSACKEGVDAVGQYMIDRAVKKGWKVEVCRQEISGNAICITMNSDVDAAPVALSGHMDTVHPVGSYGPNPVHQDEENIYGPGVLDCKSGITAGFMIMDALSRCGYRKRPVMLLLQSDEEIGSRTSNKETIRWICQQAKDAVAFFNLENSVPGTAVLSRRGIARYEFQVTGRATHSASCNKGANAIAHAAHMILELEKFKDQKTVTCNCGVISGGTTPNTVAGSCTFIADFRYTSDEDLATVRQAVETVSAAQYIPGCSCTYSQLSYRVSMPIVQRNLDLLDRVNAILAQEGLPTLEVRINSSGSDAADVTAAGIPCLDSMGPRGKGPHSINEFAYKASLAESVKQVAAIVCHI